MASKKSKPAKKAASKKKPVKKAVKKAPAKKKSPAKKAPAKKAVAKKAPKKAAKRTAKKGGRTLRVARVVSASGFVVICDVDGPIGGTFGTIGAANTFKTAHLAANPGHDVVVQGSQGG